MWSSSTRFGAGNGISRERGQHQQHAPPSMIPSHSAAFEARRLAAWRRPQLRGRCSPILHAPATKPRESMCAADDREHPTVAQRIPNGYTKLKKWKRSCRARQLLVLIGSPTWARTRDLRIKRPVPDTPKHNITRWNTCKHGAQIGGLSTGKTSGPNASLAHQLRLCVCGFFYDATICAYRIAILPFVGVSLCATTIATASS